MTLATNLVLAVILVVLSCSGGSSAVVEEATIGADGSVSPAAMTAQSYGVDMSWPMHHVDDNSVEHNTNNEIDGNPFGTASRDSYERHMQGCEEVSSSCRTFDSERIEMNRLQPKSVQNYTHTGYAKVDAPAAVQKLLKDFWDSNQNHFEKEVWEPGNTYVNHWETTTGIIDLGRKDLQTPNTDIRKTIITEVQQVLEAWTKQPLLPTSLYGIRVYGKGAVLAPHVDRLPLVSSAIINVAQDIDEPWVLEVIGHDGMARNLTMLPGEMILYESHSIIHGRPFPLKGKFYANVFIHFEPVGYSIRHHLQQQANDADAELSAAEQLGNKYEAAFQKHKNQNLSEPQKYQNMDRSSESRWTQNFAYEKEKLIHPKPTKTTLGLVSAHSAASDGDVAMLRTISQQDRKQLFHLDHNGWRPLHEAARSGRTKAVEFLLKEGAQINERTNHGLGGNALWWAERHPAANKKVIELLKKHGAINLPPKEPVKKDSSS